MAAVSLQYVRMTRNLSCEAYDSPDIDKLYVSGWSQFSVSLDRRRNAIRTMLYPTSSQNWNNFEFRL